MTIRVKRFIDPDLEGNEIAVLYESAYMQPLKMLDAFEATELAKNILLEFDEIERFFNQWLIYFTQFAFDNSYEFLRKFNKYDSYRDDLHKFYMSGSQCIWSHEEKPIQENIITTQEFFEWVTYQTVVNLTEENNNDT